jgi:mRNA-degrading endonuclease YafQ of YafQ-DinJ toxin-antitoxin module
MWRIEEHRRIDRLASRIPIEVLKRYEKWKDIARFSGQSGLRMIKGFHDERLLGELNEYRSSRLGLQWRVIYRVTADAFLIRVLELTPHDYRLRK